MTIFAADDRLAELIDLDAQPEKIATGYTFTEGPVWDRRTKSLLYVDLYGESDGGTIYRWTAAGGAGVFRQPSFRSNGNTFDRQGRLITCVSGTHSLGRTNPDGSIETLVDTYQGGRLNSPNDVVCAPNGDIIFTDPFFLARGREMPDPPPVPSVYRYATNGTLTLLNDSLLTPNGLALSDDGNRLFVADTHRQSVQVFDVLPDGGLGVGRVFCELKNEGHAARVTEYLAAQVTPGTNRAPDGIKLDSRGNLYVTPNRNEGIWVFDPAGALLGFIGVGEEKAVNGDNLGGPANLAWGDDDWQTMYVTAVTSVYRIRMKVAGQPTP